MCSAFNQYDLFSVYVMLLKSVAELQLGILMKCSRTVDMSKDMRQFSLVGNFKAVLHDTSCIIFNLQILHHYL